MTSESDAEKLREAAATARSEAERIGNANRIRDALHETADWLEKRAAAAAAAKPPKN